MVRQHAVQRVIIAPVSTDAADTLELIRLVKAVGVRVSLLPRLLEVVGSSVEFDDVDGLTMLGVRRFGLTRSSRLAKRAFDIVGATLGLIVVAPLFAAIVAAIRLDSRGPVFFRQTRVGLEGRHFEILKFRSMVADAEARKAELLHLNETSGLFKIGDDPRITRVGRFLRKTSLDELPQLINVWRGDMSLVGPRPLVLDEDAQVAGFDRARLRAHARDDRSLADPRLGPHPDGGDGRHRLPLRRELVALDRRQDPAAHRAVCARPPRYVTHTGRRFFVPICSD